MKQKTPKMKAPITKPGLPSLPGTGKASSPKQGPLTKPANLVKGSKMK